MFWSPDFFGGAWVLPHYKDNTELLRDSERLTTEKSGGLVAQFPPEYHAELRSLDEYLARWLAFIDPPKHIRIRRLLQKGFTPEVLNSFRPRVQQIVDDLLAPGMAEGRLDMISDFAYSLPVRVVCAMLGMPMLRKHFYLSHSTTPPSSSRSGRETHLPLGAGRNCHKSSLLTLLASHVYCGKLPV